MAASTLISLPEYYTPNQPLKKLSLFALRNRFPSIIFQDIEDCTETYHRLSNLSQLPNSIFDNYKWRGFELADFSLFDYLKLITIANKSESISDNISFSPAHPNPGVKVQKPLGPSSSCEVLISLIGSLTNEKAEDIVQGGHKETDAQLNDLGLILLGLFVPWQLLPPKFKAYGATKTSHWSFCWQIWQETRPNLESYTLYYADNIIQMRKSQIECQLDREQRKEAQD